MQKNAVAEIFWISLILNNCVDSRKRLKILAAVIASSHIKVSGQALNGKHYIYCSLLKNSCHNLFCHFTGVH